MSLIVGETSVVEDLEEDVEDVAMRLFDFVEEDDGEGLATDRFRQHAPFFIADISWRGPDEARYGVFFHELAHVDAHDRAFVVEERFRKRLAQLRLTDSGGAEEEEGADWAIRILQAASTAAHRVRDRVDRFVLADNPRVQTIFQLQQLRAFRLHHARDGDACPLRDDLGDFVGAYDLAQEPLLRGLFGTALIFVLRFLGFELREAFFEGFNLVDKIRQFLELRVIRRFAAVVGLFDRGVEILVFELRLRDLFAELVDVADAAFFLLPAEVQFCEFFVLLRDLGANFLQTRDGFGILFVDQLALRDLELDDSSLNVVDLRRHALQFHCETTHRFVDKVDRLIGKESVGDVAVREFHCGNERRIGDLHPFVVLFVTLF